MDREVRAGLPVTLRAEEGVARVEGYAAVFGERANIGGFFQEEIMPGAFDDVMGDDVVFLVNHDGLPLARTRSGTLDLAVDARGLRVAADLDAGDADVDRVVRKMRRGDLDKMSFVFAVAVQAWDLTDSIPLRRIKRFKRLYDVSVVTRPAYAGTEIGLRSLDAFRAGRGGVPSMVRQRRMRMRLALEGLQTGR